LVARAAHLEDHSLAPGAVHHIVARLEAQLLRPAALDRRGPAVTDGRLDDALAAAQRRNAPLGSATALDHLHQVLGDLLEETAGRVVLGLAPQRAAPGVGQVEPL